ncbi:hypothetical protein ACF1GY_34115 [Streptomyces sp. NPDC014684]
MFSGFVDPDRITNLLAALNRMGLSFTVEFADHIDSGRLSDQHQ